jgi:hypothetical protein
VQLQQPKPKAFMPSDKATLPVSVPKTKAVEYLEI